MVLTKSIIKKSGIDMKIASNYLQKFNELDAWLGKSTQKENFLKILSASEKNAEPEIISDKTVTPVKNDSNPISEKLLSAAENFMGKNYNEINCYELVVESLEKSGVNYKGKNGIASYLANLAKTQRLPVNAYMTGEGLVAATGSMQYYKKIDSVNDPVALSKKITDEMQNSLEKGSLLSFSMRTRGHTGIISKSDSDWTFINSGKMDNNIRAGNLKKAVGEEPLQAEILNWLRLAADKKEGLTITLGKLEDQKIASFTNQSKSLSLKV